MAKSEKQPWEMTREEWLDYAENLEAGSAPEAYWARRLEVFSPENLTFIREQGFEETAAHLEEPSLRVYQEAYETLDNLRRYQIEDAILEGKPVPLEVLADYPSAQELAKKSTPAPTSVEVARLDNAAGLHPDYGSWANFLEEKDLKAFCSLTIDTRHT